MEAADLTPTNVEIVYAVADNETIGRRSEGVMCLPAGRIAFGDLELPGDRELLSLFGREMPSGIRSAVGTIDDIQVKLCVPWKALLKSAPKGHVMINVRWTAQLAGRLDPVVCKSSAKVELDGKDPRRSAAPILRAVQGAWSAARECFST